MTPMVVRRNKYRDEMKKELERLRKAVPELEAQLPALRQGKTILSTDDRAKLVLAWRDSALSDSSGFSSSGSVTRTFIQFMHRSSTAATTRGSAMASADAFIDAIGTITKQDVPELIESKLLN